MLLSIAVRRRSINGGWSLVLRARACVHGHVLGRLLEPTWVVVHAKTFLCLFVRACVPQNGLRMYKGTCAYAHHIFLVTISFCTDSDGATDIAGPDDSKRSAQHFPVFATHAW